MNKSPLHLLLADDDRDDCLFFQEALHELPLATKLTTVNDGVALLELLNAGEFILPHALYLDLNMPRKNGLECLSEIKENDRLISLPVIIYSTSMDMAVVDLIYQAGAQYYIRKPPEFDKLKKVILEAITLTSLNKVTRPPRDKFILHS